MSTYEIEQTLTLDDETELLATANEDIFKLIDNTYKFLLRSRKLRAGMTNPNSKEVRAIAGKKAKFERRQEAVQEIEAEKEAFRTAALLQTIRWALVANSLFTVEQKKSEVLIHCALGDIEPTADYWKDITQLRRETSTDQFAVLRGGYQQGFTPRINQRDPYEQMLGILTRVMDENADFAAELTELVTEVLPEWVDWGMAAEEEETVTFRLTGDTDGREPGASNGTRGDADGGVGVTD